MDLDRRTVNSGAGLKDSGFVRFANQMSRDPYAQITNKATGWRDTLNGVSRQFYSPSASSIASQ